MIDAGEKGETLQDVISTGLRFRCGPRIGGLPRGRVVEIYGPESSGKNNPWLRM